MADETVVMQFKGYWRDENKAGIPSKSGVYCVYECTHNVTKGNIIIHRLIYIGEAEDVKDRIVKHEKRKDWLKHVRKGNELCFFFGSIFALDRDRAEAAMIFKYKPPENDMYIDFFPYDRTTIHLSGKTALLNSSFTVNRT